MRAFAHGLLIGKFYPPHLGHHATIRLAAAQCDRMTVVVMSSMVETIPLADRVAWLVAEHQGEENVDIAGIVCDAPMDLGSRPVWAAQVAAMRAAIRTVTDQPVDAVHSADGYGHDLAGWFDAKFVALDRPAGNPTSTAVRRDLAGRWDDLAPVTKAGLTARVVFVGAESTGTTTVSRKVAQRYRDRGGVWADTGWVAEFGREYTEIKWQADRSMARSTGGAEPDLAEIVWGPADFDLVAAEQTAREESAARTSSPLLICDTDAFATAIWERRYLGDQSRAGQSWSQSPGLPRRDLYLLTDHEGVPWDDDGLREGDLAIRASMTDWFADALTAAGHSWVMLSGTLDERVDLADRTIEQLLRHRARFGEPLTGPGFER